MKHAVIGTFGSAKTDTSYALMQYLHRFSRAGIIEEVARPLSDRGMPLNRRTTYEAQLAIQTSQRLEELVYHQQVRAKKIEHIICDGNIIMHYVFALNKFPRKARQEMYPEMLKWLEAYPYDTQFLVPFWNADKDITPDGKRSVEKQFQVDIFGKLMDVLGLLKNELDIDVLKIPSEYYLQGCIEQSGSFARYFETIYGYEKLKSGLIAPKTL